MTPEEFDKLLVIVVNKMCPKKTVEFDDGSFIESYEKLKRLCNLDS